MSRKFILNKKGMELSLNAIVILALMIIVLIVIIYFFVTHYSGNSTSIEVIGKDAINGAKSLP